MVETIAYMGRDPVEVERELGLAFFAWLELGGKGATFVCRLPRVASVFSDRHGRMHSFLMRGTMFDCNGLEVTPVVGRKAEGCEMEQVGAGRPYEEGPYERDATHG